MVSYLFIGNDKGNIVEALQFHSNTQSQRSSGQPFASRLGGQRFTYRGCTNSQWDTGFLLLVLSHYIGDPEMIDHWPCARSPRWQWDASLGRRTDNVKSWCDHTLPSPVPFRSFQVLLLATRWLVRAPGQVAGGENCGDPAISLQNTVSLVQWVKRLLLSRGSGDAQTHNGTGFLLLALSRFNIHLLGRITPYCKLI